MRQLKWQQTRWQQQPRWLQQLTTRPKLTRLQPRKPGWYLMEGLVYHTLYTAASLLITQCPPIFQRRYYPPAHTSTHIPWHRSHPPCPPTTIPCIPWHRYNTLCTRVPPGCGYNSLCPQPPSLPQGMYNPSCITHPHTSARVQPIVRIRHVPTHPHISWRRYHPSCPHLSCIKLYGISVVVSRISL